MARIQAAGPLESSSTCWNCSSAGISGLCPSKAAARLGGGTAWAQPCANSAEGLISTRDLAIWVWASAGCGEAPRQGTGRVVCGWRQAKASVCTRGVSMGGWPRRQFRALPLQLRPSAAGREPAPASGRNGEGLRLRIHLSPGAGSPSAQQRGLRCGGWAWPDWHPGHRSAQWRSRPVEACLAELRQRAAAPGFHGNLVVVTARTAWSAPAAGPAAELLLQGRQLAWGPVNRGRGRGGCAAARSCFG